MAAFICCSVDSSLELTAPVKLAPVAPDEEPEPPAASATLAWRASCKSLSSASTLLSRRVRSRSAFVRSTQSVELAGIGKEKGRFGFGGFFGFWRIRGAKEAELTSTGSRGGGIEQYHGAGSRGDL